MNDEVKLKPVDLAWEKCLDWLFYACAGVGLLCALVYHLAFARPYDLEFPLGIYMTGLFAGIGSIIFWRMNFILLCIGFFVALYLGLEGGSRGAFIVASTILLNIGLIEISRVIIKRKYTEP
jgi:hypothetical protein